jgi:hypothetical protein
MRRRLSRPRQLGDNPTTVASSPGFKTAMVSRDSSTGCSRGSGITETLAATMGASTCSSPSAQKQMRSAERWVNWTTIRGWSPSATNWA